MIRSSKMTVRKGTEAKARHRCLYSYSRVKQTNYMGSYMAALIWGLLDPCWLLRSPGLAALMSGNRPPPQLAVLAVQCKKDQASGSKVLGPVSRCPGSSRLNPNT